VHGYPPTLRRSKLTAPDFDAGIDSVLHFGARTGQDKIGQDKPIDTHAWLDAAGVEVTGYPVPKLLPRSPALCEAITSAASR
jgi:hypothetical protein